MQEKTWLQRFRDLGVTDLSDEEVPAEYEIPPVPELANVPEPQREPSPVAPTTHLAAVSAEDVRMTFHLFDESGIGELPRDSLLLCLTTLGLPTAILPSHVKSLSANAFAELCLRMRSGAPT